MGDMVTVVVTATSATVVIVTGTVVAMAVVAAAAVEDVLINMATERSPGMVMLDIKRGTRYNICIWYAFRTSFKEPTSTVPFLPLPTRKESCVCVCVCVCVRGVFILITYKTRQRLHSKVIIH